MSDAILILDADGYVVAATPTDPVPGALEDGQVAVARTGDEWIGWRRVGGTFVDLSAPPPVDLAAYADQAHKDAEARGTTWNGWPVVVNDRSMTIILGELSAISIGVRADGEPYLFADGVPRPLTNQQLRDLSVAMRKHVKDVLGTYMGLAAAVAAGTVTTTAQVDAAYAAVA